MILKPIMIIYFILLFSFQLLGQSDKGEVVIDSSALWQPGMSIMQNIHDACDTAKHQNFGACFVDQMKKSGASKNAVEFARMTGNQGYLRDFRKFGNVSAAYSVFPFRANENQVCYLVGHRHEIIDIDDYKLMPIKEIQKNKIYQKILKKYPNVDIWPGDRSGKDYPQYNRLSNNLIRLIANYQLKNGCHACEIVGYANFAFDFDSSGKFLGIKVVNVEPDEYELSVPTYKTNEKIINVKLGGTFIIELSSNVTTGYEWQIDTLDNNKLELINHFYVPPKKVIIGRGGKEIFQLIPIKEGMTGIRFKYVRPWEMNNTPAQNIKFNIIIR